MVKRHDLLRGRPFQGQMALLQACVDIIVHCTALLIDLQTSRQLHDQFYQRPRRYDQFYDDDGNPCEPWGDEEIEPDLKRAKT